MTVDQDHPSPWCRAVIRDGTVTLNGWTPNLMTGGPILGVLERLHDRGTVLADLRSIVSEEREELIVEWVPAGVTTIAAEVALVEWAAQVGYARVWLPDEVHELADVPFTGGVAEVTCPACGLDWSDSSPDFWAMVRSNGYFPGFCPACNASLPEWELAASTARAAHPVSDPPAAVRL